MKKIYAILFLLSCFLIARAQSKPEAKHDACLGYGFLSDAQIAAAMANTLKTIFSGISGEPVSSNYTSLGPIVGSYNFRISKRISLGPEINLLQIRFIDRYSNGDVYKSDFLFVNLSARLEFRYLNNPNIQLYSGISFGGAYANYRSTDPSKSTKDAALISYQINLFGIRLGKLWQGYTEFGFGRNGLMNIGVSRRF